MKAAGFIGVLWGIGGVCLLLAYAVLKLSQVVIGALDWPWFWYHWLVFGVNIIFMAYSEGYRGFQCQFSPRVAARARYLLHHPQPQTVVLAPLFCMGYFHTTRRRLISVYALSGAILILISLFQQLQQPWRGLLDGGIVVGLSWGICSLLWFSMKALRSADFAYSAELPQHIKDSDCP